MRNAIENVAAFHHACEVPVADSPCVIDDGRRRLRESMITEEVQFELFPAMRDGDLTAIADAIADSIYVLIGTALEYGIPLEAVWHEVHRADMRKVDPATGRVRRRADGKILKPDGWVPPDVHGIIMKHIKWNEG